MRIFKQVKALGRDWLEPQSKKYIKLFFVPIGAFYEK